jgi:hypothetical protein
MSKTRLYVVPDPPDQDAESKTMRMLRRKMQQVKTLAQFEAIIADAHEDHRGKMRKLLEPMLPQGLPCCGVFQLARKLNKADKHSALCPKSRLVTIH